MGLPGLFTAGPCAPLQLHLAPVPCTPPLGTALVPHGHLTSQGFTWAWNILLSLSHPVDPTCRRKGSGSQRSPHPGAQRLCPHELPWQGIIKGADGIKVAHPQT